VKYGIHLCRLGLACISLSLAAPVTSEGERIMTKAYQLHGFILSDTDLATREWSRYVFFTENQEAFLELSAERQQEVWDMGWQDLIPFVTPHMDKPCAEFFEKPDRETVETWGAQRLAWTLAIMASNSDIREPMLRRSLKIANHPDASLRALTEEVRVQQEAWDKMCFDSDMTVQESAFTMSNSPEYLRDPEWEYDVEYIEGLKRRFGLK
jgi:hypothetical protein